MLGTDILGQMILGQNTNLVVTLPEWRVQCESKISWSALYIRGTVTVKCEEFAGAEAPAPTEE